MGVELPASARCCAFSATSSETNVGDRKPDPTSPPSMSRQLRTRNSREPTTCSKVSPCRQKPAPLIPTISLDQHRILAFSARNFSIEDRASHSYGGRRTKRNGSMWLDGGHAYVYFVYGIHWCFNVVSDREEVPTACLIRALEPLKGLEEMRRRRGKERAMDLCSGPAKLAQVLGIDRSLDGVDLAGDNRIFVERGRSRRPPVLARARVGVTYAESWAAKPLRFTLG